ncbi:hypothetical protein LCGC14_1696550 [marine sediment metagenome]|uniref:Uncharacterized protein n=1 Tax=marine sediment metagenome TaxID=412755 RepID=A0A0F9HJ17_9ZZZZ
MSSEIKKKKYIKLEEFSEKRISIKSLILPFSLFPGKKEEYIYHGEEKMLFRERHPEYRRLFLSEFEINIER